MGEICGFPMPRRDFVFAFPGVRGQTCKKGREDRDGERETHKLPIVLGRRKQPDARQTVRDGIPLLHRRVCEELVPRRVLQPPVECCRVGREAAVVEVGGFCIAGTLEETWKERRDVHTLFARMVIWFGREAKGT